RDELAIACRRDAIHRLLRDVLARPPDHALEVGRALVAVPERIDAAEPIPTPQPQHRRANCAADDDLEHAALYRQVLLTGQALPAAPTAVRGLRRARFVEHVAA